jgi:membrane protein
MVGPSDGLGLVVAVARTADENDIRYPATAFAYYAFVSFVPLLLLVFATVGERFAGRIHAAAPRFLAPDAQGLIYDATTAASGRVGAVVLAIVVLVWSGVNVVVDFRTVIERVEDVDADRSSHRLRDGVVVLGSIGLAIVSIVLISVLFSLPSFGPLVVIAGTLVLFGTLTVAFLPLYYLPSRLVTTPRAALPGALTAALGWTVIHGVILFFAGNAARYAIYGVLSGIIIILTSLYVAAFVLMTGVVVNTVLVDGGARRSFRDRPGG